MLKRRSIATMMAAATVATSVAPVFAATTKTEIVKKGSDEQKALVNDLRKLLSEGTKFEVIGEKDGKKINADYNVGDSVYEIRTTSATLTTTSTVDIIKNTTKVENVLKLEQQIEALKDDQKLFVYVVDKGHGITNGKVSDVNAKNQDIEEQIFSKAIIDNTVSVVGEYDLADFYDGEYVTEKGLDLINLVVNDKFDTNKYEDIRVKVKDEVKTDNKEHIITIEFRVDYVDSSKKDNELFTIQISGNDLKDVHEFYDFIRQDGKRVKVGASKIAGETRFETAVAIADEAYGTTTPSKVVLVNATSMIDGLTAAPLAAKLEAPVLLTNKEELPKATLDYIKNVKKTHSDAEVTIVGGTGVVSDTVKKQLQEIGVKVDRIGGKDRHATSVEVAVKLEKLAGTKLNEAFVVAATGEADAMSIAPIAANGKTPIIVEGFDGMSTTANELLKSANDIDVIGGKVSKETQETYKDRTGYDFVAGEDRFETNAKIVRNYFKKGKVESIYVAKDGFTENNNEVLVDALAVGTLANKKNAAIVLASKELTVKQEEAVELVSTKKDTTVTQIGGGVKHSVVKQIAKILGYTNK